MDNVDWNDIQYFVCLVNQHTLSAAAEVLNVQHTTVARRIEKLEQALKTKLFDRMGKRYHLTREGELLFLQASNIQNQVHTLTRMAMNQDAMQGDVIVSAPPVLANEMIMPFLPEFYQQYPHIRLSLQGDVHRSNLHQKEADIALRIGRPTEASLVIRKLRDITYQLYAHPNYLKQFTHLLATTDKTDTADDALDTALNIIEFQGSKKLLAWTNALKKHHNANLCFATNDLYICKHAIKQQIGMGILPDLLITPTDELIAVNTLKANLLGDLSSKKTSELYLVMHEDVRLSPRVRAVADWLVSLLASD